MTALRLGGACLALLLVGCDSTTLVDGTADTFRTEGTDYPHAAAVLEGGEVVVGALVDGVLAPTDGTIGYPAVVRFGDGDAEAAVYDDDERDYYGVDGVAPLGGGLALAVGSEGGVRLYRADRDGRNRRPLAHLEGARFLPDDALHATPAGLVLAVYAGASDGAHVYGLSASGDVRWTYRLPEAQDVRALDVLPDGDVVVVGPGRRGGEAVVARLSPDGAERWRREVADVIAPVAVAATEAGLVVLGQGEGYVGVRAVRLGGDGAVVWGRTLSEERDAWPGDVVAFADGATAVAFAHDDGDFETGNESRLVVLDADGAPVADVPVGTPYEETVHVRGLLALPDGRLGVVAAVGPRRLGGYGGDDFDIEVGRFEVGALVEAE